MTSDDELQRYRTVEKTLHDVHRILLDSRTPDRAIEQVLARVGLALHADRVYTFAVTADQLHSSCTYEWTSRPEYGLRPFLQNVDQKGLTGWLDRFKTSNTILIEDVANPPDDLRKPAAKFARDSIRSIYVYGFFDDGKLIGYLGVDFVARQHTLDRFDHEILFEVAATLNLYILRYDTLELWNRTVHELPSALFIKDLDSNLRYTYANPRYLKIYGEQVVGKTDLEIFGDEIGQQFRAEDHACFASGKPMISNGPQLDYSKVAKGYYALVKFPVTTRMGGRYIAGFITDISAEHALRMQALELLEKAKSAEKAKSFFLASMSHEIRTPLNVIIGLVEELRHADVPEDLRSEYLVSVLTASRSLLVLINDVLDMSKIEAGQMRLTHVATDIAALLNECAAVFAVTCRARGLTLDCTCAPDIPHVSVDATRLKQILFNLIGNAVKFTQVGGITVTARSVNMQGGHADLVLDVTDTGIGIAPEEHAKVFELFEQSSMVRGTRVANSGTGLGLSLCRRLAQCLNGDITLVSARDKGSTFTVTLKALEIVQPTPEPHVGTPRAPTHVTRVLIVDDLPMNLKVLGLILKRMGITATPADSVDAALAQLRTGDFSHVLTDMWMPGKNGEDLARAIRANPDWRKVRVAAQTADVEATHNFDATLFDAILAKPITAEKIRDFLNSSDEANQP